MSKTFHECGLLVVVDKETRRVKRVAIAAEVGDIGLLRSEEVLSVKIGGRYSKGQEVGSKQGYGPRRPDCAGDRGRGGPSRRRVDGDGRRPVRA